MVTEMHFFGHQGSASALLCLYGLELECALSWAWQLGVLSDREWVDADRVLGWIVVLKSRRLACPEGQQGQARRC